MCFCWKVYLLSIKRAETKEAAHNAKERLSQLETVTADFKGQSLKEKLQDNMQFRHNPLVAEFIKDVGNITLKKMRFLIFKKQLKDWKEIRLNKKTSRRFYSKRSESISKEQPLSKTKFKH